MPLGLLSVCKPRRAVDSTMVHETRSRIAPCSFAAAPPDLLTMGSRMLRRAPDAHMLACTTTHGSDSTQDRQCDQVQQTCQDVLTKIHLTSMSSAPSRHTSFFTAALSLMQTRLAASHDRFCTAAAADLAVSPSEDLYSNSGMMIRNIDQVLAAMFILSRDKYTEYMANSPSVMANVCCEFTEGLGMVLE